MVFPFGEDVSKCGKIFEGRGRYGREGFKKVNSFVMIT